MTTLDETVQHNTAILEKYTQQNTEGNNWKTIKGLSLLDPTLPLTVTLAVFIGVIISIQVPFWLNLFNPEEHANFAFGCSVYLAVGVIIMIIP